MRLFVLYLCAVFVAGAQQLREVRLTFSGRELVYSYMDGAASAPAPLLVLLHPDVKAGAAFIRQFADPWKDVVVRRGWNMIVPWGATTGSGVTDAGAGAIKRVVEDAATRFRTDPGRVYLVGAGDGASQVFYLTSRVPDLWTAVFAIGGDPRAAITSDRLFGANTSLVPFVWSVGPADQTTVTQLHQTLTKAGFNVQLRSNPDLTAEQTIEWLSSRRREEFHRKIDCETGNPSFARCYWVEIAKFDTALRNDVLRSTRVPPGTRAYLDVGGFGFDPSAPGPGVLVSYLPPGFKGPLMQGDRIVALAGREIRDGRHYLKMMEEMRESKSVALMIERAGKRQRIETKVILPKREETVTARIQAEYLPDTDEIQLLSRGVAEARLRIPANRVPVTVNWNGNNAGRLATHGCWVVSLSAPPQPCTP